MAFWSNFARTAGAIFLSALAPLPFSLHQLRQVALERRFCHLHADGSALHGGGNGQRALAGRQGFQQRGELGHMLTKTRDLASCGLLLLVKFISRQLSLEALRASLCFLHLLRQPFGELLGSVDGELVHGASRGARLTSFERLQARAPR